MTDTTLQEAVRCPKCQFPGEYCIKTERRDGSKSLVATCRTKRCRWYDTSWPIDIQEDGSIAQPRRHRKVYSPIPDLTEKVRAQADLDLHRSVDREL